MKNKMRVGFDINETLDNSVELLLEYYNKKYRDNLTIDMITDYNIYNFLKVECDDIFQEFIDDQFMSKLKLRDGAKEVLDYCYNNFEVRFVTATFPNHFNYFYEFLKKNLDWIKPKNMVRIEDKQYYEVDILVDDWEQNLIGGKYKGILITKKWNEQIDVRKLGLNRADNLHETKLIIEKIAWRNGIKTIN